MIIIFTALITILLFVGAAKLCFSYSHDTIGFTLFILGLFAACALLVMVIGFIGCRLPMVRNRKLAEYQQTYYTITQTISNDDNAVFTLTSQIAQYNADVLKGRMMQDSTWFGVLDYDFYYDLPLIELNSEG